MKNSLSFEKAAYEFKDLASESDGYDTEKCTENLALVALTWVGIIVLASFLSVKLFHLVLLLLRHVE